MNIVTEMSRKEKIVDVLREAFAILCLIAVILGAVLTVKACSDMVPPPHVVYQSKYTATYGNFFSGYQYYKFDTYVNEGNHYVFYDAAGKITGDVFVSGNNVFSLGAGE